MPYNGSNGTFSRLYSFQADAAANIKINSVRFDNELNGMAAALSNCITRDGQGVPSAPISWNNQNLTNVASFGATNAAFSGAVSFSGNVSFAGTASFQMAATATVLDPYGAARLVGYRSLPTRVLGAAYTVGLGDVGFNLQTASTVTIPANATTPFIIGDAITISNASSSAVAIQGASGVTIRLGGTSNTGNRSLAAYGMVTLIKQGTDEWWTASGGVS